MIQTLALVGSLEENVMFPEQPPFPDVKSLKGRTDDSQVFGVFVQSGVGTVNIHSFMAMSDHND